MFSMVRKKDIFNLLGVTAKGQRSMKNFKLIKKKNNNNKLVNKLFKMNKSLVYRARVAPNGFSGVKILAISSISKPSKSNTIKNHEFLGKFKKFCASVLGVP